MPAIENWLPPASHLYPTESFVPSSVYGTATDSSTGISYVIVVKTACEGGGDSAECNSDIPGNMQACEELGYMSLTTSDDCLAGGLAFSADAPYTDPAEAAIPDASSGRTGGSKE